MAADTPIERFWKWFVANEAAISRAYTTNDADWFCAHLSHQVDEFGPRLHWELGPYNAPDQTFVLSPVIRENLPFTRAAVNIAPRLPGWHFLHAKPPKILKRLLFQAKGCTVDAEGWKYQMQSYNKGEFVDLLLYINQQGFPSGHEDLFAELVVEALLGEELRLERVGLIQPNLVEDNRNIERLTPIKYLREHLLTVLSP